MILSLSNAEKHISSYQNHRPRQHRASASLSLIAVGHIVPLSTDDDFGDKNLLSAEMPEDHCLPTERIYPCYLIMCAYATNFWLHSVWPSENISIMRAAQMARKPCELFALSRAASKRFVGRLIIVHYTDAIFVMPLVLHGVKVPETGRYQPPK